MESTNTDLQASGNKLAPTDIGRRAVELLSILLADVASDVDVAMRDLKISDASFTRCRRAMDRVACAQRLLETVMAESVGAKCDETVMRMRMRMREAVELLARGWPEDYPVGAVEWLLADEAGAAWKQERSFELTAGEIDGRPPLPEVRVANFSTTQ